MSALRNQAAADERQVSKLVETREFANAVQQKTPTGERLLPVPRERRCQRSPDASSSAATASKRSGCLGANTISAVGIPSAHLPEALRQHRLFAFERAARHQHRTDLLPVEGRCKRIDECLAFAGGLTSNFRFPPTCDSLWRCANLHQPPRIFVALRQEKIHVLHHATQATCETADTAAVTGLTLAHSPRPPACPMSRAWCSRFGQNSLSASTSSFGRNARR